MGPWIAKYGTIWVSKVILGVMRGQKASTKMFFGSILIVCKRAGQKRKAVTVRPPLTAFWENVSASFDQSHALRASVSVRLQAIQIGPAGEFGGVESNPVVPSVAETFNERGDLFSQ